MAELDIQKRMELKELVAEIAYMEKNIEYLCMYIFSKKNYLEIKDLYAKKADALGMGQAKKAEELTKKIDNYAYLVAGLVKRINSDSQLRMKVASNTPDFETTFKKLSDWISENGVDKELDKFVKSLEARKGEIETATKNDPFIKMLQEKYDAEKKR